MKVWKVEIMERKSFVEWVFYGLATTAEIAARKAIRAARKQGLRNFDITGLELMGDRDF